MSTEAQSCAHCGAALTNEWTCPHCGQDAPAPWSAPTRPRTIGAWPVPEPPSPRRLDPGRPGFKRAAALTGVTVLVVVGAFVANAVRSPEEKVDRSAWVVGACVNVNGTRARAVDCGDAHDGRVTRVVRTADQCDRAVGTVTVRSRIYCVELDAPDAAN